MKINFSNSQDNKKSVLVFVVSQEALEKTKNESLKNTKIANDFKAKSGQIIQAACENNIVIFAGVGKQEKINDLTAQNLGGHIAGFINGAKIKDIAVNIVDEIIKNPLSEAEFAANIAFGAQLKNYRFNKYFNNKKEGKDSIIENFTILLDGYKSAQEKFVTLDIIAKNVAFARDLISEPSNVLHPENYAKICQNMTNLGLEVELLGESAMEKLGMNSLLGVGKGSQHESHLVVMKWNGAKNKDEQPIAFVGKGVTFDTGGISIKPSLNMEDMKTDMGGSAVVVSLMRLLAQRKANVNAVGVVGLVENMPAGDAQKPGDVVTSMSGQTIEVVNTDAEGRMVLADALHYTNVNFKPKFIVDLATLTGAIIVALADVHAGLFSNDDNLSEKLKKAGKKTGETVWRLPVSDVYDKMINSDIADMKNVGSGRGAGSTTAAQFLHRFVGDTPWAHLDIAGVAWDGKGNATAVKGATGYGVKLLNKLIEDNYES